MHTDIPFVDLYAQYQTIKDEVDRAIDDVIQRSSFVRGPYVTKFEQEFAKMLCLKHCVSCGNGTDSLYIAMSALGVKPGDEVLVPAHSWISTSETITQAGGKVVFCDTNLETCTIDPKSIEKKITKNTVGIIPVHLFGHPAEMDAIMGIAQKHNLWVIEDCAQAHLAKYQNRFVGTFGTVASFSFYPGKNLGAMGDAGAVLTNDKELAEKMKMFARHGGLKKGDHQIEGINSRMDALQAAILSVKLPYLPKWTAKRRERAARYSDLLADIPGLETPKVQGQADHAWHLYVVKTRERDALAGFLSGSGVATVVNYPVALPFLPAYKRLKHVPADFPNAFNNQSRILSLPIYPELTDPQMDRVVNLIREFFG
ncbi:DegT/DnrJ/EryC1/StrS family aminotransferase [Alphaproteobacteria bacterium]|nr:DegT/DnrJ/EryC1/StrS family aminotransferase [Alphaproteobacteria bacterium]